MVGRARLSRRAQLRASGGGCSRLRDRRRDHSRFALHDGGPRPREGARPLAARIHIGQGRFLREGHVQNSSRQIHSGADGRADGIAAPPFASIDEYLSVNTDEYYRILDEVDEGAWQPERDARPWVRFCLTAHFLQARTLLRRTQEYDRLWEELERDVKHRGLPERMISALAEAAIRGSLTAALYESATMASAHEASDDLERLVEAGLLVATSDKSGRCYLAADALKAIRARIHDPEPPDQDPFA